MIYDAIERAYAVALANFSADLTALAAAKGITVTTTCAFQKRQSVERALDFNAAKPFCCITGRRATTMGRVSGRRDSLSTVVFDYYAEGTDPVRLAKQVQLAAEALLRSADRCPGDGSSVFGVGEEMGSMTIDFTDGYLETASASDEPNYYGRATVTIPIWDQDVGL